MHIKLANPRGFCAGVDRAIEIVNRALEVFGPPIYVRHEVVHNKFVVEDLRARGWTVDYVRLDDPDNMGSFTGEVARAIARHDPDPDRGQRQAWRAVRSWLRHYPGRAGQRHRRGHRKRPTRPLRPALDGSLHWTLISNLSLNYVSLLRRDALVQVLRTYDFPALHDKQAEQASRKRLAGIEEIETKPVDRLVRGMPVRGRPAGTCTMPARGPAPGRPA